MTFYVKLYKEVLTGSTFFATLSLTSTMQTGHRPHEYIETIIQQCLLFMA